ncbi:MAG TPA: DoxX family protein [Candidatus Acidoferrales bacterium]|nr:DoxX family protein [Candidatus Acidoferrales bacterium]
MEIIYLIGRILFAAVFVSGGYGHLTKSKQMGGYAKSMGVPASEFMTILTGIMILVGGVLVVFDFYIFYGALLIFLFLIPTSFMMHAFWKLRDPGMKQVQQIMFMKNMSMAGAALMIMCFTYGVR